MFNLSKNMAAVGHLWFFLLSHRLRNEWNLPIRLASMYSWILVKWCNSAFRFPASLSVTIGHHAVGGEGATPHSNPQIYTFFVGGGGGRAWKKWPFSHLWQIRLTFIFERICHTCEEFARICHTCEEFEWILYRYDKYVWILHTSKIRHLWKTRTY